MKLSEEPFFLQRIAEKFGCTDKEFRIAFAEAINSKPKELDNLIEEQMRLAKGFLNEWGALFILFQTLKVKQENLEKACKKYLIIAKKLPRKKGEQIVKIKPNDKKFITPAEIKTKLKNRKPTLSTEIKEKAKDSLDDLEAEVEKMMEQEQEVVAAAEKPKKKTLKTKKIAEAPPSRTKGHKRSIIAIFNGGEGSGKSKMAQTFPNAFTLDLEDKLFDLIDYDDTLNLQEGEIGERVLKPIGEKREILFATGLVPENDYVVGIIQEDKGDIDYIETEANIEAVIGWFMLEGYDYFESFIIDVGKAIRDASIKTEEIKKGRTLGQFEYIPITKNLKLLLIPLIHFCRKRGKNLVLITHWEGIYETRKNAQGFDISVQIGQQPDIKSWIRDLVTWRIDFLKPQESGFDEKFIIDFQKAPGEQYFKLDITNKNLFEIISNPEILNEEKEIFRQLRMKRILAEKKEEKK